MASLSTRQEDKSHSKTRCPQQVTIQWRRLGSQKAAAIRVSPKVHHVQEELYSRMRV